MATHGNTNHGHCGSILIPHHWAIDTSAKSKTEWAI